MKQITKYIADDGREFIDEPSCRAYEARLASMANIKAAIPDMNMGFFFVNRDAGSDGRVLSEDDLPDFLADNANIIIKALTPQSLL